MQSSQKSLTRKLSNESPDSRPWKGESHRPIVFYRQQTNRLPWPRLTPWHGLWIKKDCRALREYKRINRRPVICEDFGKILAVRRGRTWDRRPWSCRPTAGLGWQVTWTAGIGFAPWQDSLGLGNPAGRQSQSPLCLWDAGGRKGPLPRGPIANKNAFYPKDTG